MQKEEMQGRSKAKVEPIHALPQTKRYALAYVLY